MAHKRKFSSLVRFVRQVLKFTAFIFITCAVVTVLQTLCLRWMNPPTSAFMLAYQWKYSKPVHYQWVDMQEISENLAIAAVASEDQRFPYHHGLDFTEIENAWLDYMDGKRLRGASTISQQVVKNLFLWPGRSLTRKLLEFYFTGLIEWLWGKERILEVYLNIAEFGDGVYGVQAASERYYHRSAKEIGMHRACLMIAVLPNPKSYNLYSPSRYHQQRARAIETSISRLGGIKHLRSN